MATEGIDVEVPVIQWAVRDLPGGESILLMIVESSGSHHEFFISNDEGFTPFYTAAMNALRKAGNDLHSRSKKSRLIAVSGVLPNGKTANLWSQGWPVR